LLTAVKGVVHYTRVAAGRFEGLWRWVRAFSRWRRPNFYRFGALGIFIQIEIYETQDGKWIGHICFISGETARHDEYTAMVADSQDELRQQLLKYKHVGSNSYKLALSVALDDDDLLVEEIE
jgi:hypothetical protein